MELKLDTSVNGLLDIKEQETRDYNHFDINMGNLKSMRSERGPVRGAAF